METIQDYSTKQEKLKCNRIGLLFVCIFLLIFSFACRNNQQIEVPFKILNITGKTIEVITGGKKFDINDKGLSDMLYIRNVSQKFYIDGVPFDIDPLYIYDKTKYMVFEISLKDGNYTCGTTYIEL
jgi:imidazole glycerol phosphate synthase subunit HisF